MIYWKNIINFFLPLIFITSLGFNIYFYWLDTSDITSYKLEKKKYEEQADSLKLIIDILKTTVEKGDEDNKKLKKDIGIIDEEILDILSKYTALTIERDDLMKYEEQLLRKLDSISNEYIDTHIYNTIRSNGF